MNLENQVCSLELSKQLKELGIKQESLFCWCGEGEHLKVMLNDLYDSQCNPHYKICSAFTVGELGEILPKELIINSTHYYITQIPARDLKKFSWVIFYRNSFNTLSDSEFQDDNEANARAKMLIHLLDNGFLDTKICFPELENLNEVI